MGKFLQTNLVPVHIRDVTAAEDHYFQQKMMEKLITDLGALLKDDKQSLRHSSTELTSIIDAIAEKQLRGTDDYDRRNRRDGRESGTCRRRHGRQHIPPASRPHLCGNVLGCLLVLRPAGWQQHFSKRARR